MKVRIPDHVDMTDVLDLTKGKLYDAEAVTSRGVYIKDDDDYWRFVLIDGALSNCAALQYQATWEVVKEETD